MKRPIVIPSVITSAIIIAFLLRMAFPKLQKVTCRRVSQILHTE